MNFIKGRDNLACTIFVPVICGNNCSFCNTKKDYDGFIYDDKYLTKILNHINNLNKTQFVSEFVITGGEPFADLDILEKIVNACEKPVFINTSLPKTQKAYNIIKFINENKKVRGVNISRHIGLTHSVPVYGTEIIDMIEKPVRINCLVTEKNFQMHKINELLENYIDNNPNRLLNLRADYRTINDSNLKSRDYIFNQLLDEYEYVGSNGCLACYTSYFNTPNGDQICYHRGIENSAVVTKDKIYVNAIINDSSAPSVFKSIISPNSKALSGSLKRFSRLLLSAFSVCLVISFFCDFFSASSKNSLKLGYGLSRGKFGGILVTFAETLEDIF